MIIRGLAFAFFISITGVCSAQSGSMLNLPSLNNQGSSSGTLHQAPAPQQVPVPQQLPGSTAPSSTVPDNVTNPSASTYVPPAPIPAYSQPGNMAGSLESSQPAVYENQSGSDVHFYNNQPQMVSPQNQHYPDYVTGPQNYNAPTYTGEAPRAYRFPQAHNYSYGSGSHTGLANSQRGNWAPGGYEPRSGSPDFYSVPGAPARGPLAGSTATGYYGGSASGAGMSGGAGGDPYQYHFGPGFYRSGEHGHFRFPFYSYRRPWYHPGFAGYNRDTNLPW